MRKRWKFLGIAAAVGGLMAIGGLAVASHGFSDVPDSNVFHDDISWLADSGVTRGCNPPENTLFCPTDEVTRQQMAAFLRRLAEGQVVDAATVEGHTVADIVALADGEASGMSEVLERLDALEAQVAELETKNAQLESLLEGVSRAGDELVFSGMNVRIDNGTGTTTGTPNGLGNLIVGYNEGTPANARGGSHNVVVGSNNSYASFGGLVVGSFNEILNQYSSVVGGFDNVASGRRATISGGSDNLASGTNSSVSGGSDNVASGIESSVLGGSNHTADDIQECVPTCP